MAITTSSISNQPAYQWGAMVLFAAVAVIACALAFEHIGGYAPCPMCLQQRYAYYVAIPVLFVALTMLATDNRSVAVALFFFTSMILLANAAFGVYHAGVEWGFWDAPTTCAGGTAGFAGGGAKLLSSIRNVNVVNCAEPALVILGLSLAGWNAVICIFLSIASLKAAFYAAEQN